MFRGEPLALSTILTGYIFFIITIFLGLFMPGSLIENDFLGIFSSHYISAFFGWIGLVILGAQLQFFRAIAGIRRFEPDMLRYMYYCSIVIGLILLIIGNLSRTGTLVILGLGFYSITVIIHSFWLFREVRGKLFRFPLNYLIGSHIFFLYGMILTWISILDRPLFASINFEIIHVLGVGWISLNLQGAMIRILPMFVGKTIDRGMRPYIDWHFYFSFVSSLGLVVLLPLSYPILIWIFGILWMVSWVWVIILLIKSVVNKKLAFDKPYTLLYFVPGFISLALGAMIGFHTATANPIFPRATHIHLNLLSGLSLIMLGAMNRITSFQMYTLLYTGRKEEGIRLEDFLHEKWMKILNPGFVLSTLLIVGYFAEMTSLPVFQVAIIILSVHILGYGTILLKNVLHFKREYKNAIPYYLKPSEVTK